MQEQEQSKVKLQRPFWRRAVRWMFFGISLVVAWLIIDVGSALFYPRISPLAKENPEKSAFMAYREKQWEANGQKKHIRQKWVPLSRISPFMLKAVIISEDDKFFDHEGFDFEAMAEAVEKDMAVGKFKAGASTISQQLAKNLFLSPSKTPVRKLKEAILTWRLEQGLSKRRILELYLNVAEWGDGVFGIEAAARSHFGKSAAALSAEECARLAVVLPNPIRFSASHPSRYIQRRADVIYRIMIRRGIVIPEYQEIMSEEEKPAAESVTVNATEGEHATSPEGSAASDVPNSAESTQPKVAPPAEEDATTGKP